MHWSDRATHVPSVPAPMAVFTGVQGKHIHDKHVDSDKLNHTRDVFPNINKPRDKRFTA